MPSNKTDLRALRNMISEAETVLSTTKLPQGRAERARELLTASVALADELLKESPAAILGAKGGRTTAQRMKAKDPDYYRKIAAKRKTRAGGRPRKPSSD